MRKTMFALFIVAGVALMVTNLAGGDVEGALWAALRVFGRLA